MNMDFKKKCISNYLTLSFFLIPIFIAFLFNLVCFSDTPAEILLRFFSPIFLTAVFSYYVWKKKIIVNPTLFLLFILSFLMAIYCRIYLLAYQSGDYGAWVKHWISTMKSLNFPDPIVNPITNYNVFYNYILYIISRIPIYDLYLIKFVSIFFDGILAITILTLLKKHCHCNELFSFLGCILALLVPSLLLNSALWGQCDSIYASLSLIGLIYYFDKKPYMGSIFFGLALSMKLQAFIIFPILIFLFTYRLINIRHLLLIPLTYILILIPAIILGKPISESLFIYEQQIETYQALSNGSPTLWALFPQQHYFFFMPLALGIAGIGLFIFTMITLLYRKLQTKSDLLELCFIFSLLIPFLLPKMHERYFFFAITFSIIYLFLKPQNWICVLGLILIDLFAYEPFLLGQTIIDLKYLSILNLVIIVYVIKSFFLTKTQETDELKSLSVETKYPELILEITKLITNGLNLFFSKIHLNLSKKILLPLLFLIELVALAIILYTNLSQGIYIEHPEWKERLEFIDKNTLIRNSVHETATIVKHTDSELILDWKYAGKEQFIKQNNIFKFQEKR